VGFPDEAAAVESDIALAGEPLTLRKTSAGTWSDTTRSYTGESTGTTAITGFVAPYKAGQIDGSAIVVGDLEVRLSALALGATVIESGDVVDRAGKRYRVVSVDTRGAGGTALMVILQLRGTQ